ncbi:Os03g0143800 [Oryza sativa Japonica Group]|uniref:Os03g0143800 protein n=1 Tax=Oryza sativa subsp. japonica TaxID=39947 RepID=A0A0P0VSX5_ORYSJ|nr:Os03g0143800 [Oryza sativa Japonica Group]
MAIPVEEAIAALSTFSLEDEQPDVQGLAVLLSSERYATNSPIEYSDVAAYRLSLGEDTKAINQLVCNRIFICDCIVHSCCFSILFTWI